RCRRFQFSCTFVPSVVLLKLLLFIISPRRASLRWFLASPPLPRAAHRRGRGNAQLPCAAPRCPPIPADRAQRWPAPIGNLPQRRDGPPICRPHGAQNHPWGNPVFPSTHGPAVRPRRPPPWGYVCI